MACKGRRTLQSMAETVSATGSTMSLTSQMIRGLVVGGHYCYGGSKAEEGMEVVVEAPTYKLKELIVAAEAWTFPYNEQREQCGKVPLRPSFDESARDHHILFFILYTNSIHPRTTRRPMPVMGTLDLLHTRDTGSSLQQTCQAHCQ